MNPPEEHTSPQRTSDIGRFDKAATRFREARGQPDTLAVRIHNLPPDSEEKYIAAGEETGLRLLPNWAELRAGEVGISLDGQYGLAFIEGSKEIVLGGGIIRCVGPFFYEDRRMNPAFTKQPLVKYSQSHEAMKKAKINFVVGEPDIEKGQSSLSAESLFESFSAFDQEYDPMKTDWMKDTLDLLIPITDPQKP